MRETIATGDAPAAIGPYSQAVRVGELLFISGQLGLDPKTGALVAGVAAQTERALENLAAILAQAGCTYADVVKATIFVANLGDFQTINGLYGARFPGDRPARSTVQVAALPLGGLVEIEMVAYVSR